MPGPPQAALGKELLLLEPPDRRPEEWNTTSCPSSTPSRRDPGDNTHAAPHLIFTLTRGCGSARRVSDARSGELSPGQCSPARPAALHPLLCTPPAWPSCLPCLLPLLLHPRGGAHPGPGSSRGQEGAQPQSPGAGSPQPAGSARGPQGEGTWQPWTVCPDRKRNFRQTRQPRASPLHFLPFQGNLKLPSSKQPRYSGFLLIQTLPQDAKSARPGP